LDSTSRTGNYRIVTTQLLSELPRHRHQLSFEYDERHSYHLLVDRSLVFGCLVDRMFDRKVALAFLFDCADSFWSKLGTEQQRQQQLISESAAAFSLEREKEFASMLSSQMDYYSSNPSLERIQAAQRRLQEVRDQLEINIESLLHRNQKIELLTGQAREMSQQARKFQERGAAVKQTMYRRNLKHLGFLVIGAVVILWLIVRLF
jgi:vesicle-associated membrane protein 7